MIIDTDWTVFTGAPSSGKTTVLMQLQENGYDCMPEVARDHIEQLLKEGIPISEILSDARSLHADIIAKMIKAEERLSPNKMCILDRAYPDGKAFWNIDGLERDEYPARPIEYHYRHIFIFEPLPVTTDGIRVNDDSRNRRIDNLLEQIYSNLGYNPVRVPIFSSVPDVSIKKRMELILDYLSD